MQFTVASACFVLAAAVIPVSTIAASAGDTRAQRVDAAIRATPLAGSHFGVLVTELPSGRVLYERNAGDAFVPASTVKLITGAAALDVLGRSARFTTTLALRGARQGSQFTGDVIVHGDSDPALRSADLHTAVAALQGLGIASVRGKIVVENSITEANAYPEGWLIDDRPFDYAAPSSDVFVDANSMHVQLRPAASVGARANLALSAHDAGICKLLGLTVQNSTQTVAHASDDIEAQPYWLPGVLGVGGPVAISDGPTALDAAIPDPRAFMRAQLLSALREAGIDMQPGISVVGATRRIVWTHRSPPVAELVRTMWTRSDNQYAEALLLHIGAAAGGSGDPRTLGLAREYKYLQRFGIDKRTVALNDGSGLSRYNLASPRMFARLLMSLWATPVRQDLLAGLPLAGRRGTLLNAFAATPIAGAYYAKTGGMRNVANMTGYLHTPSNGWLSVSMFADDAPVDDAILRRLQTRILQAYLTKVS